MAKNSRNKTLTTKVSEEEYRRIAEESAAKNKSVSEYLHSRLFEAEGPNEGRYTVVSRSVLASVIGARLLMMTAIYDLMRGGKWTNDDFARHAQEAERQGRAIAAAELEDE